MRQFENLITEDGIFDVKIVWKSKEGKYIFYNFFKRAIVLYIYIFFLGLQREILKIERK